jgi:hypothetical protein
MYAELTWLRTDKTGTFLWSEDVKLSGIYETEKTL